MEDIQNITTFPRPPATQNPTSATRMDETPGSQQRSLDVRFKLKVSRADGVTFLRFTDDLMRGSGKNRRFRVSATDGAITRDTGYIKSKGVSVEWDVVLGEFTAGPSSRLTLRLFAKRRVHSDALIGTLELPFASLCFSSSHVIRIGVFPDNVILTQPTRHVTIHLEVIVSEAASSPTPDAAPDPASVTPGVPLGIDSANAHQPTPPPEGHIHGLHPVDETLARVDDAVRNVHLASPLITKNMEDAGRAPDGLDGVDNLYDTWKSVIDKIQWVVDVTDKIAEIHPYAKMAWSILSFIPKTFLEQVERDRNVLQLLQAIHHALDLLDEASFLRCNNPLSKQTHILEDMIRHICDCGDFIQAYARSPHFWERLWRNTGREIDSRIRDYCTRLVDLREEFLRYATVAVEEATFHIREEATRISHRLEGISSQLESISADVAGVGTDAKIREIPYPRGASFRSDKRCLTGTRTAFLDRITDWINNPESSRALVLFGQAGTGKSSIAHELAFRFHEMHRLSSSFVFSRREHSNQRSYLFLTGLVRDLSDRYPAFWASLGKKVENDTHARLGSEDFATIFDSLLLQPLATATLIGPIFIIIDAIDESEDAFGYDGIHTFLAGHICDLPPNFRIVITSRPEQDIKKAFSNAKSIDILRMDDPELSGTTDDDIRIYLCKNLSPEVFSKHGDALLRKAGGLFQWAAVACGYIKRPPRGLTVDDCICRLLAPSSADKLLGRPLDDLYWTVLSTFYNDEAVRSRFQSVLGLLLAAFEPFSVRTLTGLRHQLRGTEKENASHVLSIIGGLGSLLSNATSSNDALPIVPLHASFRDFLTDQERSGSFHVDIKEAHHQLASASFATMHHALRHNICGLETSHQSNDDVEDLPDRISKCISSALSYACRFWDYHLEAVPFVTNLY
ncbi:hypothetical protein BC834DRAFT_1045384 [Gloeopeniophorella convolvens]|nr:hypothetical protein BC834DRAFT_1045384 [Gloeopeniophorella convolvens]